MKKLFRCYDIGFPFLKFPDCNKAEISNIQFLLNKHTPNLYKKKNNFEPILHKITISSQLDLPRINIFNNRNVKSFKKIQSFCFSTNKSKDVSYFGAKKFTNSKPKDDKMKENKEKFSRDKNNNFDKEEGKGTEFFDIKNPGKIDLSLENNFLEKEKDNIYSRIKENNYNSVNCNLDTKKGKKKSCFDFSEQEEKNSNKNYEELKDDSQDSSIIIDKKNGNKTNMPRSEIKKIVKDEDLIIMKKVRGSGPGGQHLNKTSSAVYLKDTTTNIAIKVSNSRDSIVNEGIARKRLIDKLDLFYNGKDSKLEKKNEKIRKQKSKAMKRSSEKHSKNNDKDE